MLNFTEIKRYLERLSYTKIEYPPPEEPEPEPEEDENDFGDVYEEDDQEEEGESMIDYVVITDGSCKNQKSACSGAIIKVKTHTVFTFSEYLGNVTNTYAEVYAVYKALAILKHECAKKKFVEILVVTDFDPIVKVINRTIPCKLKEGKEGCELYRNIMQMQDCKKYMIRAIHIPSHKPLDKVTKHFKNNGIDLNKSTIEALLHMHKRMDTDAKLATSQTEEDIINVEKIVKPLAPPPNQRKVKNRKIKIRTTSQLEKLFNPSD